MAQQTSFGDMLLLGAAGPRRTVRAGAIGATRFVFFRAIVRVELQKSKEDSASSSEHNRSQMIVRYEWHLGSAMSSAVVR